MLTIDSVNKIILFPTVTSLRLRRVILQRTTGKMTSVKWWSFVFFRSSLLWCISAALPCGNRDYDYTIPRCMFVVIFSLSVHLGRVVQYVTVALDHCVYLLMWKNRLAASIISELLLDSRRLRLLCWGWSCAAHSCLHQTNFGDWSCTPTYSLSVSLTHKHTHAHSVVLLLRSICYSVEICSNSMGVSHSFCMGDWGLFVNAYYAKMLNYATLKEDASFH